MRRFVSVLGPGLVTGAADDDPSGIAFDFADINPVKALYWSAVVNGLLAPFLLLGILVVASDREYMHGQQSSLLGRSVVAVTALLMFGAAAGMFLF